MTWNDCIKLLLCNAGFVFGYNRLQDIYPVLHPWHLSNLFLLYRMKSQKGTFYNFITSIFINDRLSVLQPTTTTCTSGRWTATQSSGERCGVSVASSAPNLTTRWVQSWYTATDDVFQRHILEEDSGNTQCFCWFTRVLEIKMIQHINKENHQRFCLTCDYFRFCQSAITLRSFQTECWAELVSVVIWIK